jgi:hypothetical protein
LTILLPDLAIPLDEGINVRDLSLEDSDGPIGINPVEMTTPAPNQKV